MSSERAVSLLALAIAAVATLALFFGNFTLAYLLQALRGERIPAAGTAVSLLLTLLSLAALAWGGRLWWRVRLARRAAAQPAPPRPRAGVAGTSAQQRDVRPTASERESDERTRLLALAGQPGGFGIEEALAGGGLRPNDLTYLLDAMIAEGRLDVVATEGGLRYRLAATVQDGRSDDGTRS